jgi:hypothetical protein
MLFEKLEHWMNLGISLVRLGVDEEQQIGNMTVQLQHPDWLQAGSKTVWDCDAYTYECSSE